MNERPVAGYRAYPSTNVLDHHLRGRQRKSPGTNLSGSGCFSFGVGSEGHSGVIFSDRMLPHSFRVLIIRPTRHAQSWP
jgi:hypothetical protein